MFWMLWACNEYDLKRDEDVSGGDTGRAEDSAPPEVEDSDPPEGDDTASQGPPEEPDTGTATEPVYLNTASMLYAFDPATATASVIGEFRQAQNVVNDMTDIAIDLSGRMYGVSFDVLYRIDATTAEVTPVGHLGVDDCNGLTFVSDGTLVAVAGTSVMSVDTTTGASSLMAVTSYTSSGDIVGLPDGYLYWSVSGWGSDSLVRVDPATGGASNLGSTSESSLWGLGYAYGELWAFSASGKAHVLDATDGGVLRTESVAGSWYGATTNPVLW